MQLTGNEPWNAGLPPLLWTPTPGQLMTSGSGRGRGGADWPEWALAALALLVLLWWLCA